MQESGESGERPVISRRSFLKGVVGAGVGTAVGMKIGSELGKDSVETEAEARRAEYNTFRSTLDQLTHAGDFLPETLKNPTDEMLRSVFSKSETTSGIGTKTLYHLAVPLEGEIKPGYEADLTPAISLEVSNVTRRIPGQDVANLGQHISVTAYFGRGGDNLDKIELTNPDPDKQLWAMKYRNVKGNEGFKPLDKSEMKDVFTKFANVSELESTNEWHDSSMTGGEKDKAKQINGIYKVVKTAEGNSIVGQIWDYGKLTINISPERE